MLLAEISDGPHAIPNLTLPFRSQRGVQRRRQTFESELTGQEPHFREPRRTQVRIHQACKIFQIASSRDKLVGLTGGDYRAPKPRISACPRKSIRSVSTHSLALSWARLLTGKPCPTQHERS